MAATTTPTRSRWFKLVWIIPIVVVGAFLIVLAAKGIRGLPAVQSFLHDYPGQSALPSWAPVGFPAWLEWQHFLSSFFMLFIIRTGWQVHTTQRAAAYWTRKNAGLLKTKGQPVRIPLHLWFHLTVDSLWVLNGIVFYVLIFVTGQWVRIIPTRWDVFPNAVSAGLQYASLEWPTEDGWTNYNALQLLSYFLVVFVAAPLAILTGLRMVPGLAARFRPIEKLYPLKAARAMHYPIMIFFVAFIIVHVALVLATGALRNLNHMYGGSDDVNWVGFAFFAGSLVLMVGGWFAARPVILAQLAGLGGRVGR
ncbi:cytochrome b/b6 domain-containing protein [Lysinimonas soli]|uniref:Cytochrome b/b6 domain-containing protein n=1 Tax=Lysinimonas soli TaxID=1074233 RepID=A0ABW0NME6_9MICO